MTNYYDPGTGEYAIVDGIIIERDALRVAEAINNYDENLVVLCVDPDYVEGISEEPFVVAERGKDGILRPVLRAWELNDLVLERIKAADGHKFNGLKTLEQMETDLKKENQRRYNDIREETKDIVGHIAGIKSRYSVKDPRTGDTLVFYDDRPAERK